MHGRNDAAIKVMYSGRVEDLDSNLYSNSEGRTISEKRNLEGRLLNNLQKYET